MIYAHSVLFAVLALAARVLPCGTAFAEDVPTRISATILRDKPTFWRQFMTSNYGPYDGTRKCWRRPQDAGFVCMRPHRFDAREVNGSPLIFIVTGGSKFGSDGLAEDCHACPGVLGLYVLRETTNGLSMVATNGGVVDFGGYGQVPEPDNFSIAELGHGVAAWFIRAQDQGQGIRVEHTSIFALSGNSIVDVGHIPTHYDDTGNCENGRTIGAGEPCSDYSFTLTMRQAREDFSSIIAKASGTRKGQPLRKLYEIKFNPQAFRYVLPADFPDD